MSLAVVIPTTATRPSLVNAVRSVLRQTRRPEEILVIVDRREADIGDLRAQFANEATVRVLRNEYATGPSGARMFGVHAATCDLIAFLDDDDTWFEPKLEVQMREYAVWRADNGGRDCVVLTRCLVKGAYRDYVLPRALPDDGEDLVDYLYGKPVVLFPRAYVATPSILTSRRLLISLPFDLAMKRREDIEWLIRVTTSGVGLLYLPNVLTVVQARASAMGGSLSSSYSPYQSSLDWGNQVLAPLSARLHRNYLVTTVVRDIVRQGHRRKAWKLAITTLRAGSVSKEATVSSLILLLFPRYPKALGHWLLQRLRSSLSLVRLHRIDQQVLSGAKPAPNRERKDR